MPEPGGQRLDLFAGQAVLHTLRLIVPIHRRNPGPVREVALPKAVCPDKPHRRLSASVRKLRPVLTSLHHADVRELREEVCGPGRRNLEAPRQALESADAPCQLGHVHMLERVFEPHTVRQSGILDNARHHASTWPEQYDSCDHEECKYSQRECRIDHAKDFEKSGTIFRLA